MLLQTDFWMFMTIVALLDSAAEVGTCEFPGDEACQVKERKTEYPYPELTAGECVDKYSITACCKNDGFGAQYQAMMNIYLYTRYTRLLQYCRTEWTTMTHDEDAKDLFRWVGGHLYGPPSKSDTYQQGLRELWWPVESRDRWGKEEILGFYFSQPKPKILLDKPKHFTIHIRRGDMMEQFSHLEGFYVTDKENVQAIVKIKEIYSEEFSRIHILSDAKENHLKHILGDLRDRDIQYKLHLKKDVDLKEAFHHMVMADVLIYGTSEFCRAAAFLNGGGLVHSVHELISGVKKPTDLHQILPGTKVTDNGYFAG